MRHPLFDHPTRTLNRTDIDALAIIHIAAITARLVRPIYEQADSSHPEVGQQGTRAHILGNTRFHGQPGLVKSQEGHTAELETHHQGISLRLPQHLLDSIKVAANARDVPYQSLIKVWLQEKLHSH